MKQSIFNPVTAPYASNLNGASRQPLCCPSSSPRVTRKDVYLPPALFLSFLFFIEWLSRCGCTSMHALFCRLLTAHATRLHLFSMWKGTDVRTRTRLTVRVSDGHSSFLDIEAVRRVRLIEEECMCVVRTANQGWFLFLISRRTSRLALNPQGPTDRRSSDLLILRIFPRTSNAHRARREKKAHPRRHLTP